MKAEYCVKPAVEVYIDPASAIPDKVHFDGADVYFEISEDKLLKNINVVYTGFPIQLIERGSADGKRILINLSYPEVTNKAFKVILYFLNYIQAGTGMPVLDISRLKSLDPAISPETQEEEDNWKNCRKIYESTFRCACGSVGVVSFDNVKKHSEHAKAYANFADAQNDNNPITKYESFYKVIEYFLGVDSTGKEIKAEKLDRSVSDFMSQHDSTFTPSHFEKLRLVRNRCMHPHQKYGHISSSDIELMEELSDKTKQLERIAELLLKHK